MNVKEDWMPLLLAAALGTSGGGGMATVLTGQHSHPDIIEEIREVQYDSEIFRLNVAIQAMEESGHKDTAAYTVAVAQLTKFTQMLTDLDQ